MIELKCPNCKILLTNNPPDFVCSSCGLKIPKVKGGHTLSDNELLSLATDGKTEEITFLSKNNIPYKSSDSSQQ
jgi:hypothetical protein